MNETSNQISEENMILFENKKNTKKASIIKKIHNNFENDSLEKKEDKYKNNINNNTQNNNLQANNTTQRNDNKQKNKNETKNLDISLKNNMSTQNIIDSALQSQLSKINVKLLDFDIDKINKEESVSNIKILPIIDLIEYTLLNEGDDISEFKQFGFGIYVFFLYLINLLITFAFLLIFCFRYMYCIFFKYYKDVEDDFSTFYDYDILSLLSGSQIIKFRKYYISNFGKEKFLKNYKDFDVFYKEYFFTGTLVFILIFVINFFYNLYLRYVYMMYKKENPEIQNFSLIISWPKKKNESEEIKNQLSNKKNEPDESKNQLSNKKKRT